MGNITIYLVIVAMLILGLASFVLNPIYPNGAWIVLVSLSGLLNQLVGGKLALATPTPRPPAEPVNETVV